MDFYQMRFYAFAYLEYIIPTLFLLGVLYTIILTKRLKQPKKGLYDDVIGATLYALHQTDMLNSRWSTFITFNWLIANTKKYKPILDEDMKLIIHNAIQKRKELNYYFDRAVMTKGELTLETLHTILESFSKIVGRDFKEEYKIARESNALFIGKY